MGIFLTIGISTVVVMYNHICYYRSFGCNPDFNHMELYEPISDNGFILDSFKYQRPSLVCLKEQIVNTD